MKKQYLFTALMAFALVSAGVSARADEESEIDGSESFHAKIILVATENAPGGSGKAKLEMENEDGVVTGELEVETEGVPGPLFVSVVKASDGSVILLGQAEDEETEAEEMDEDDEGDDSTDDGEVETETEAEFGLPEGLDATDIAQIVVTDADGIPLLVGEVMTPSSQANLRRSAKVRVSPGSAAPIAKGTALLQAYSKKGKRAGRFMLQVNGVAPRTVYDLQVNGVPAGSTVSGKSGRVMVRKLPVNLFTVQKVELVDPQGAIAVTARF